MGVAGFVRFVFRFRRVFVRVLAAFLNFLQKLSSLIIPVHRRADLDNRMLVRLRYP